ncbi:MAG: redox-regulated ATPase YchF [Candidatus Thermoplasmatota archaeon]
MGMQIGIVGKPNVGKSTFFNAATEAHAAVANYPFTTIQANHGVMYIRTPCPCVEFKTKCTPHNSKCINGTRFVPIEAIDVAGLVPDAHKGRGLGNKFLDDLRQADAFVDIVDASGSTDADGNPCDIGMYDPLKDVEFLETEINYWMLGILKDDWERLVKHCELQNKKIEKVLEEKLTGLGIKEDHIINAMRTLNLDNAHPSRWNDDHLLGFVDYLRRVSKPMIIAFNKSDKAPAELIKKKDILAQKGYTVIPTSAESELALNTAAKKGIIEYTPGSGTFNILKPDELNDKQRKALDYIKTHVLDVYGSTGVQKCIDTVVSMLRLIVVYPVEDPTHLTDKQGRILPDAYLVPSGTTARDLAYKIHTDLGEHFIRAIDARTHRVIGADHVLKNHDVISIIADV